MAQKEPADSAQWVYCTVYAEGDALCHSLKLSSDS